MSDARLRELRAAAGQDPEAVAAYRRELERVGLCPDCEGRHAPPSLGCEGELAQDAPGEPAHALGTRVRYCMSCRRHVSPTWGRWAGISARVVDAVLRSDPCPARLEANLRAANPFPAANPWGDGFASARTTWQRHRRAALEGRAHAAPKQPPPAPGQLDLFGSDR